MARLIKKRAPDKGVASFYHLPDERLIEVYCNGTACFAARHLNPERWLQAERQWPPVHCLGKCYAAPASTATDEAPIIEVHARKPVLLSRIASGGACTIRAYANLGGYVSLAKALTQPPEAIIRAVEISGLRGRGGAAFPTGKKWRAVAEHRQTDSFVIANADEGDPGSYIDRLLIENDPYALIEGLTIAAYAVAAKRGYIYLRKEYPQAHTVLQAAIKEARDSGFLGGNILGSDFSFDLELIPGSGSYICGEETSLINSIEGKRPEARPRPPYPTEEGLFGKPTLVNNVETLANIPWIVDHGAESYRQLGFSTSRGTKLVSLASLFNRPGLYEVEFGIQVRQIIEQLGGGLRTGTLKGVIIGGPLAGIIPPHLLDTPFGFEELHAIGAAVGHGGVVAFDENTSIAELVHQVFEFGAFESCGRCTPCRLGSRAVEQVFKDILRDGRATAIERTEFAETVSALALTSLCGLGTGLAEFAKSAVRYYPEVFDQCFA